MIRGIFKLLRALNTNSRPGEVGAAVSCGLMLALIPSGNLLWIGLIILFLLTRINTGTFIVSLAIFRLAAPLLDSVSDSLGYLFLTQENWNGFFTWLINLPLIPFTDFNNTLVSGGFLLGLLLWIPMFFFSIYLVNLYRNKLRAKIVESKIFKRIMKMPLVSFFADKIRKAGNLYQWAR